MITTTKFPFSIARIVLLSMGFVFASMMGLRAQQPQTPSAKFVDSVGTTYDNCPYPGGTTLATTWGTANQGTPVINPAPPDTRRGMAGLKDENSASVMAGPGPEYFFVVSIDAPGNAAFDNPLTTGGNTLYAQGYQGITLREISPSTGGVVGFVPLRLDDHKGVCALPRIVKDDTGNLYIFWRERTTAGDQVMACHFNVFVDTLDVTPRNICGDAEYVEIREMQVATDTDSDHGAAVIIRDHFGATDDRIYAQRVHVNADTFVLAWTDTCGGSGYHMRQIGGYGITCGGGITACEKFSPVIAFNEVKNRYDLAWADSASLISFLCPDSLPTHRSWAWADSSIPCAGSAPCDTSGAGRIMIQTETIAGSQNYPAGGASIADPHPYPFWWSMIDMVSASSVLCCEFYMQPIKGYIVGGVDSGATVFMYRQRDDAFLWGTQYNLDGSPGSTKPIDGGIGKLIETHPTEVAVFPCAISKRSVSDTVEHAIGVIAEVEVPIPGDTIFKLAPCEWNPSLPDSTIGWTPGTESYAASSVISSKRFESYIATNENGIFAAVPNIAGPDMFQLSFDSLSIGMTPLNACQTRDLVKYPTGVGGDINDSYYTTALGTGSDTNWGFLTYDYGVNSLTPQYPPDDMRYEWAYLFTNLDSNHETDEKPREQDFEPDEYNFTDFSHPYTSFYPPVVTAAPVEHNTLEYNPHTAVYRNWSGTVYEEIDALYNSNIVLGTTNQLGAAKFQMTNAMSGDTVYYQPKVAIGQGLGCSSDYFAIITYIRMIQDPTAGPPTFSQTYCYNTVDLTTSTIGTEAVLETAPSGNYWPYFRNWDVVHDTNSPGYIFVYSDMDTGSHRMCTGEVLAAIFDSCGAYSTTTTLQSGNGNTFDQVRACYDPDPSNYGAYVTWRQTLSTSMTPGDSATIDLVQVSTTGSVWGTGVISQAPGSPFHRGEPVVCASPTWIYDVWADDSTGTSEIFATPWSNTGSSIPATSNIHGTRLSGGIDTEAFHPDVIVNPDLVSTAMVAWDEDCPIATNGYRHIRLMNSSIIAGPLKGTSIALATPHATPVLPGGDTMNDAERSLYGYMQRRPKLVAVESDSEAFPYDVTSTYPNIQHWILCAYETEGFNLYGSGVGFCTGGTVSGIYASLLSDEDSSSYGYSSGYMQNNIVAKAVNPNLAAGAYPNQPLIGGELCIAANSNAQDLWSLNYSPQLGPVAGILDYVNTNEMNAIASAVIARPIYAVRGGLLPGVWNSPSQDVTIPPPIQNTSWMPLVLHPAVGSSTTGVTAGTWTVDPSTATLTLAPLFPASIEIDYISPGIGKNVLILTADLENIAGQWPLSAPASWGLIGDTALTGYGLKPADGSHVTSDGSLSVTLADNPANASTSALVSGIVGISASIRVLNVLGLTLETIGNVGVVSGGTRVPLDIGNLTSGSYMVEAIGSEGSHASVMLTVTR